MGKPSATRRSESSVRPSDFFVLHSRGAVVLMQRFCPKPHWHCRLASGPARRASRPCHPSAVEYADQLRQAREPEFSPDGDSPYLRAKSELSFRAPGPFARRPRGRQAAVGGAPAPLSPLGPPFWSGNLRMRSILVKSSAATIKPQPPILTYRWNFKSTSRQSYGLVLFGTCSAMPSQKRI